MNKKLAFEKLLEPGKIGRMALRNRIVMAPMVTDYGTEEGFVTEQVLGWYRARAEGVGLVIVETTCVQAPVGRFGRFSLVGDDDKYVPGLNKLAEVVHNNGAKIALQLQHQGGVADSSVTGQIPVGPSSFPSSVEGSPPCRELTKDEIAVIIGNFAKAARRAKQAGYDGIEIHGAHNYLIAQFLSSYTNKRQDSYGGSLANRARMLLEIIKAVKSEVGPEFPVWSRLNGSEYDTGNGFTPSDAKIVSHWLEEVHVDAINVSACGWGLARHIAPAPDSILPAPFAHLARAIKKTVSIPVLVAGLISPEIGEVLLREKTADFVCFGRAIIADPELPKKIYSGKLDEVRPCLVCQTCGQRIRSGKFPLICSVNAAAGHEVEYAIQPVKKAKRLMIVGGGPAGMEAARVAALRGHEVVLYEQNTRLGGQLLLAGKPPLKERILCFTNYLVEQVKKLGVRIELGQEVTLELVQKVEPDAVIVATGIKLQVPQMPGMDKNHVLQALDVLAGKVPIGDKVVVLGGELVGCETAEFLVDRGKQVTVTRRGSTMAAKMVSTTREYLMDRLKRKGVVLLPQIKYQEVTDSGLVISNQQGQTQLLEADNIILAVSALPNEDLFKELNGMLPEVHRVGDCVEPRDILNAISDGYRTALAL